MAINYADKYSAKIDERFKTGPLTAPEIIIVVDCRLDDAILSRVKPGHFQIDPNEVVFIGTHAIFHPYRVTLG